jgi:uncharacterized protein with PIN domain
VSLPLPYAGEPPRFAVDRMLGRLARWLRLLGFDALYRPEMTGHALAVLAAREGRIVLTRDRRLARTRLRASLVFVEADRFRDQLRELDARHPLAPSPGRPPRCGDCNRTVEPIAAEAVPESVPEYVRATQSDFRRCPRCRRIYWPATHWERMRAEVARLELHAASAAEPGGAG